MSVARHHVRAMIMLDARTLQAHTFVNVTLGTLAMVKPAQVFTKKIILVT